MLGDALRLIFAADHEAADILEEQQGRAALLRELDEVRAFDRAFAEQHAIIGQDRDRHAPDMRKAADQRRAVQRLEFVELRAIHDPRDDFAHVVGRDFYEVKICAFAEVVVATAQ